MEATEITLEEIEKLLEDGNSEALQEALRGVHPSAIAELVRELPPDELLQFVWLLDEKRRVDMFGHLPLEVQRDLSLLLEPAEFANLISRMPHDERVDLVQRLTPSEADRLLRLVAKAERDDIRKLASYEAGTAGAVMTSDYALLREEMTAEEAIRSLREAAPDSETIYTAYVVDNERHLKGVISLQQLILANPKARVSALMRRDIPSISASSPQHEAAQIISRYDLLAVPVLDEHEALVGIVTFDDAMDVAEVEVTEDMHRMAAASEVTTSIREASVFLLFRKRVGWLLILVLMNVFSGAGLVFFEDTIAAIVPLVFFLPLLIGSGGNAGSQSATLMIRSLATGDVHLTDWFFLLRREVLVALMMGIPMGLTVSVIGVWRAGPDVAVVVALAMVSVVLVGSLMGMCLPFLLQRLRLDPAMASAPLVASLADVLGVLIYFGIASWYLRDIIQAAAQAAAT